MVLTCSGNLTDRELNLVKKMACMFNIHAETTWSSNTTHIIVVPNDLGNCYPTQKFLNGMLNNCFIVTHRWVQDCITSKSLLPEVYNI